MIVEIVKYLMLQHVTPQTRDPKNPTLTIIVMLHLEYPPKLGLRHVKVRLQGNGDRGSG